MPLWSVQRLKKKCIEKIKWIEYVMGKEIQTTKGEVRNELVIMEAKKTITKI